MKEAQLLEGRHIAEKTLRQIEQEVKTWLVPPTIVALSVGGNKASEVYLNSQKKILKRMLSSTQSRI